MRNVRLLAAVAVVCLGAAVLAGCTDEPQPAVVTPEQQRLAPSQPATLTSDGPNGRIVYDLAHGEIFRPDDTSQLGQSAAVQRMQEAGYGVTITEERLKEDSLDGVAAYYVAGPMRGFTDEEKGYLDAYLESGGTVVLTIHIPYPVLALPARWGLPLGTAVVVSPTSTDPVDPGVFVTDNIAKDPLTEGVNSIAVLSGWAVSADKNTLKTAKLVVSTGPEALADTNGNQQFDSADKQAPFGVVGVTTVGSGRVIVLGDDAIFANVGIGTADNGKLFDNILKLISAPKGA